MKMKLLLVLLCLPLVGCQEAVIEPACMAGYDKHITYVSSIQSDNSGFFMKCYGVCHMNDFWGEYPIEVKKMSLLDTALSMKSMGWVVNHEKAHRFEAIQRSQHPTDWIEFEDVWVNRFGKYDPETFADAYANLRQGGIKSPKQKMIYDFMTKQSAIVKCP